MCSYFLFNHFMICSDVSFLILTSVICLSLFCWWVHSVAFKFYWSSQRTNLFVNLLYCMWSFILLISFLYYLIHFSLFGFILLSYLLKIGAYLIIFLFNICVCGSKSLNSAFSHKVLCVVFWVLFSSNSFSHFYCVFFYF